MSTQYIYLARHGQTVGNVEMTLQGKDDPLTELGHEQAKKLAKRATHISFDHLLASDLLRAEDTARYIAEDTGKEVVLDESLREVPESLDDDQYLLVSERVQAIADMCAGYGSESLFIVTSGNLIKYLLTHFLLGEDVTPKILAKMHEAIRINNTGISVLRRNLETGYWTVVCINDHAHFADN